MFDNSDINKKIEDLIFPTEEKYIKDINSLEIVHQLVNMYGYDNEVVENEEFYYIKRGENPKAVMHLNIGNILSEFSYRLSDRDYKKYIFTDGDPGTVNPLIILTILSNFTNIDFDILITMKNFYDKRTYISSIKDILRSDNIVNFNLRQSNCIAESFASYTVVDIDIPLERTDYKKEEYSFFTIGLKDLVGGNSALDVDKVRSNAIRSLLGVIRKIKAKVDIEILSFDGGNKYDNIPNSARCEICVHKEFITDLIKIFELEKNAFLEKYLKLEPNVNLYIEECEFSNYLPMNSDSFSHLSSFIELSINGAYSVDSSSGQLISSSTISNAKTYNDRLSFVLIFRSLSNNGLEEMIEKTRLACKVSNAELTTKYYIPLWQNKDDFLTNIFKEAYKELTNEDLKIIRTQYSLEGNVLFNSFPVKMISLGVKYNKDDNNEYYSNLDDISLLISLIKKVLYKLEEN